MLGSGTLSAVASTRDSLFPNRDTRLKVEDFESIFRKTPAKAIAGSNHETGSIRATHSDAAQALWTRISSRSSAVVGTEIQSQSARPTSVSTESTSTQKRRRTAPRSCPSIAPVDDPCREGRRRL